VFKQITYFLVLTLFIVGFSACSKYQKLLKSSDTELKYNMAIKYYEEDDYYRALQLFDELIPFYRGTEKAEKIGYYYAYSYYGQEEYIMASYYFKNFLASFPKSDKAEECAFMTAYCKYMDSPDYSLDQTNTYGAIKGLQLFINKYPESTRIPECNDLIDKLRLKLETKAFETARLYFDIGEYKAAIHAFMAVLKDYPDTHYKEKVLYYVLKSNYLYASNSIDAKKEERFNGTIKAYEEFVSAFPESELLNEAGNINKDSLKEINKIKNKQS